VSATEVAVGLVYLRREGPGDIDNIIKPILDGLVGVIYEDDSQVVHVRSSLLDTSAPVDITDLPVLLRSAVADEDDCVYVTVSQAKPLKDYV
jgi:crossover junction endodeoxyribonuclease RusA